MSIEFVVLCSKLKPIRGGDGARTLESMVKSAAALVPASPVEGLVRRPNAANNVDKCEAKNLGFKVMKAKESLGADDSRKGMVDFS